MLHVPVGANTYGLTSPSWGTSRPAAANGTSVTPGTGGYGSWYQLFSAISFDAFGIFLNINSNYTSAASRNTAIAVGYDPAGGSSYWDGIIVGDLICGNADSYTSGGRSGNGTWYYFPFFIPAGSSIGVSAISTVATAFRVGAILYQKPMNPSMIRKGSWVSTFGASGYTGTNVTPGTTSEGAWVSLGTTSDRHWWWQIGVHLPSGDTSHNAAAVHYDLAVGDASNKDIIIQDLCIQPSAQESITNAPLTMGVEWDVPAGSNIYIRAQTSGTAETNQAAAYGMGG